MPLSHEHQMSLLKDILTNHQTDCCGSVSECEQVERLVKSLMINMDIDSNVKTDTDGDLRIQSDGNRCRRFRSTYYNPPERLVPMGG